MKQTVEDCGRDDRINKDRTPIAVAFVAGQDDAGTLVARTYNWKKMVAPRSSNSK
jgi:hypothetical protein